MDALDGAPEFSHTQPAMKIERGYAQHVGSRNEQQDAGLVLFDDGRSEQLVLVADGMGGHAGGSLASAQVAETARRVWADHQKAPLEPKRLLERIIREGHESINRAGAEKGLTPRSTCVLLFLHNGSAHWAHVGDSRIYRLRDGQVARLTRDHSVVQMLVDLGKVSEDEMGTHPDQNRLTQSLGGDANPMPDFGNDGVKEHDAFLVCSDGLWEMIPQVEMAATLSAKRLGDDGAKHLVERAFDRAKPKSDNITVALLRIGGPPPVGAGADPEEARTTRILGQPPLRRASGGGARWGFAAATVVALGAAAAVVYKPWDKQGLDSGTTPAVGPKKPADADKPPTERRTEPPKSDPARPDGEPRPAERREAVPPPPPPQRTPEAPPPTDKQPAPDAAPPGTPSQPQQPSPQPGAPAPGDRGATTPPEPPATGGEPAKKPPARQAQPPRPAQPATPRQSGLGPDEKKSADPPPNSEKPNTEKAPEPPATQPQGPGQPPETKPQ
jgi:serine/threonine protein phosphatase PrpC